MPLNEAVAYFDPGDDLNGQATATITGRRFIMVSGAKQIGSQALANDTLGGSIPVAPCTAGKRAIGVAPYDCAIGYKVGIVRGKKVFPVETGAAMTAGDQVMSDGTGRAITWVTAAGEANSKLGVVLNTPTAAGQTAIVALDT
jgi:hypothetical protein